MRFIDFFLTGSSAKADAPTRRRLPYLAGMNFLLLAFFLLSAFLRFMGDPAVYGTFFAGICATEAFFVLSLFLLKFGKPRLASYVGTSGILVNVLLMAFLTPFTTWSDLYKLGVYLIGAVVANALVSLERRQIVVYMAASLGVYASIVLIVAATRMGGVKAEGLVVTSLFLVLFATVNVMVILMHDINAGLVDVAEAEAEANRSRAERLRALVATVSGALETGRDLVAAAGEGKAVSGDIRGRLTRLAGEAGELQGESAAVDAESVAALERVNAAKTAVEDQNVVIVDAGAAVERLSQTIREIAAVAGARRGSIAEVAEFAERQSLEIHDLLRGVERIREASGAVMQSVGGIIDVSEKTQLLAMNASIEAAHAGTSGKGFAVIASEIRKLSQETQESTKRIGEAIKANDSTIREQSESIGRFSEGMGRMTGDVKSTFEALGGMMDSLGQMDGATANLSESTLSMLRLAGETKSAVLGVVEGLESGARSAKTAKEFASRLSAEVAAIFGAFDAMDDAVGKASSIGEKNLSKVAELDSGLVGIEAGLRG